MEAVRIYWGLRARGVRVTIADGRLWFDAPAGQVTTAVRECIRPQRAALVRLLSEPCPCPPCAAGTERALALRIHCASGLDTDPTWAALRREFDALDEADERVAIQDQGTDRPHRCPASGYVPPSDARWFMSAGISPAQDQGAPCAVPAGEVRDA